MKEVVGSLSKEETLELADVFSQNKDSAFSKAWLRLVEGKIEFYYFRLATTPDNAVRILCSQMLKDFGTIPEQFIQAGENIKAEETKQKEKDIEKGGKI